MEVSIVIVNYNTGKLLRNCIESVIRQTFKKYEIIVVDNNSSDDSLQSAMNLKDISKTVKMIRNEKNVGFACANNQAFKVAEGKYVFLLNPDTVILQSAIDKLVDFMDENPEVGVCGPKNLDEDRRLQYNCHHFPSIYTRLLEHLQLKRLYPRYRLIGRDDMTYWNYNEVKEVDFLTGCSLLIHKEALEKAGWLDEAFFLYAEEMDLCYRLKKDKWKVVFCPEASIIHFGGQSSIYQNTEKVFSKSILRYILTSKYYFFKKHHGTLYTIIYRAIDILFFSVMYVKNLLRIEKDIRKDRLEYAREAIIHALHNR